MSTWSSFSLLISPLSTRLFMKFNNANYFRNLFICLLSIYLPSKLSSICLFIKKLRILFIRRPSSKVSLGLLLLFCHLIESSSVLDVKRVCGGRDEGLSGVVCTTWLISTSEIWAIIFLRRWDVAESTIS